MIQTAVETVKCHFRFLCPEWEIASGHGLESESDLTQTLPWPLSQPIESTCLSSQHVPKSGDIQTQLQIQMLKQTSKYARLTGKNSVQMQCMGEPWTSLSSLVCLLYHKAVLIICCKPGQTFLLLFDPLLMLSLHGSMAGPKGKLHNGQLTFNLSNLPSTHLSV